MQRYGEGLFRVLVKIHQTSIQYKNKFKISLYKLILNFAFPKCGKIGMPPHAAGPAKILLIFATVSEVETRTTGGLNVANNLNCKTLETQKSLIVETLE